jgi:hypothetical protein
VVDDTFMETDVPCRSKRHIQIDSEEDMDAILNHLFSSPKADFGKRLKIIGGWSLDPTDAVRLHFLEPTEVPFSFF